MDSIETRLHDAKLASAIEDAATRLPESWSLEIYVERGGYAVSLNDPGGEVFSVESLETMAETIRKAIGLALEFQAEQQD